MMYSASGGYAIGPPWQITSTSGFTPRAASAIRWIRSTQSATGILYVVVIFCFLGELTGQLLRSDRLTF